MFDTENFSEIIHSAQETGNVYALGLFRLANKKLRMVRKMFVHGTSFCHKGKDAETLQLWLTENFEKLDSALGDCMGALLRMGRLRGKGKLPFYFDVFYRLCNKPCKMDEKLVDDILTECSENMKNPDLKTSRSLVPLFVSAVCIRICECFEGAESDFRDMAKILAETENLFYTLDSLCNFNEERAIKSNKVERALSEDSLYPFLTDETKASYRRNLSELAKKKKVSELSLAKKLVGKSGKDGHIGEFLCDKPKGGRIYLSLLFGLSVFFTLLLCLISPVFVVSIFSVYGCTKILLDKLYCRFFRSEFVLPCVKTDSIPDCHGVMVVITALLTGQECDKELFEKLEEMYFSNGGKNVYFGLLCDLCDSHVKNNPSDGEIIKNASDRILEMRKKHGDCFFLLLREREYSQSEASFVAPERKRGAVAALAELLCEKHDGFSCDSIKPSEKICRNVRYVFTLDSDTNLAFDCLLRMTGIMLHPQNFPVFTEDCSAVTGGYGILQPAGASSIKAAGRNFFTRIMCGHGGADGYGSGVTDNAMRLFGQSIFCGKGMFDKNAFLKTLCEDNGFEHERVLSHDAPEGARLRCAFVPDVVLTDSFPSEELSYYKRLHRWIRGDIQNIRFLPGMIKTVNGEKIKNRINYAGRFFILHNVLCAMISPFAFASIVISAFVGGKTGIVLVGVTMSFYMLPFVHTLVSSLKVRLLKNVTSRYYTSGIYTGLMTEFVRMIFRIGAMVKSAFVSGDAIIRSAYRSLVSHEKLLEWTTSAQSDGEKKDGLLGYVRKNLVSAIAGAVVFLITDNGFVRLLSLFWFFMPVFSYHTSRMKIRFPKKASETQREMVKKYCRDMWEYFSENVTEVTNFLPPDNVAVYPERKISRMTSPTNIGFYLLSVLCARQLGFIDNKQMYSRLKNTLSSVCRLEKAEGLLYNWYDIFTAHPMPDRFVSSVDIGNFIACLMTVKEAIEDFGDETADFSEIKEMLTMLISCDLSKLYDKERGLFFIGGKYDEKGICFDRNRYDMLMSEARLLSFAAIAKRCIPVGHYKNLARTFVEGRGYMGLASWSGTAFEYFLPEIFLPSPKDSLVFEALNFAFYNMLKNGAYAGSTYVFGISESCYNEFDGAGNYRYRAFGINELSLDVKQMEAVISPYSSFLFLPFAEKRACQNLENLRKIGAYGEYGFYESVDFERPSEKACPSVVKCFMSHHIGMSMAAATNFLCDFAVSDWFSKNPSIKSALSLVGEMIPYEKAVKRGARRHYKISKSNKRSESGVVFAKLCNGETCVCVKRSRFEIINCGQKVSRREKFSHGHDGFFFCLDEGPEQFVFDTNSVVVSGQGFAGYVKTFSKMCSETFDALVKVTIDNNTGDIVRINMSRKMPMFNDGDGSVFSVSFYPLLDEKKKSRHCDFFDSSDICAEIICDKEVFFKRISRGNCFYCGTIFGENPTAEYKDGRITLKARAIRKGHNLEAEFALCFSDTRRCAEMGFVRCCERDFETASAEYEKRHFQSNFAWHCVAERKAAKSTEKECCHDFPIDSGEAPFLLYAGKNIAFLAREGMTGVTFSKDINVGRLSLFCGTRDGEKRGERFVFGKGFDLCLNAEKCTFLPCSVLFEGKYMGENYSVSVFACADLPCKIICIKTASKEPLSFEFTPETSGEKTINVGSGLAFFDLPEKSEKRGFVLGFCRYENTEIIGAGYETDLDIRALFGENTKEGQREYVFCIGCDTQENACEIRKAIMDKDMASLMEGALDLCEKTRIDYRKMPSRIKKILSEYFVFPGDGTCRRIFVDTEMHLFLFDAVLTLYTEMGTDGRIFEKVQTADINTPLSELLLCLFVSIYAETHEIEHQLYRRCLSLLFDHDNKEKTDSLYCLCLESFSLLCDKVGDVRTLEALKLLQKEMRSGNSKGVFL